MAKPPKLKLLPYKQYVGAHADDPIRFYHWPVIGGMYRRRVELCLAELRGGDRILEVGFGSGVTFMNLHALYKEIYGLDLTASTDQLTAAFRAKGINVHLQNGNVLNTSYPNDFFDSILLISILEHLKPTDLNQAFQEIRRILKPNGQVVYGVPVERPLMVFMFRLLGYNIREHHFSTEKDVVEAAHRFLTLIRTVSMTSPLRVLGSFYEVGHFVK